MAERCNSTARTCPRQTITGLLVEGQDYLRFLRTSSLQGPGLYEIYYAGVFEVAGNSLKPLLRKGNEVFEESKNATPPEVVDRVQKAKRR